ncbi:hypothetical protein ABH975_005537 [Bradyrhizobium ottawaense]
MDHQQQECQRCRGGNDVQEGTCVGTEHADDGRHPHVLTALKRDHRSQHGEPQEQDAGKLIRPDDRSVKDISSDDAGRQNDDLGEHQERRRDRNHMTKHLVGRDGPAVHTGLRRRTRGALIDPRHMVDRGHDSLPAAFSS